MILVCVVGFFAGIISGMGIGGGTLLIPALLFLTQVTQHQAQGINLVFFIPTAVAALYRHNKQGNLEGKLAWSIVLPGFLGAFAGAFLAVGLSGELLQKTFAGFLCIMGIWELGKAYQMRKERRMKNEISGSISKE